MSDQNKYITELKFENDKDTKYIIRDSVISGKLEEFTDLLKKFNDRSF